MPSSSLKASLCAGNAIDTPSPGIFYLNEDDGNLSKRMPIIIIKNCVSESGMLVVSNWIIEAQEWKRCWVDMQPAVSCKLVRVMPTTVIRLFCM